MGRQARSVLTYEQHCFIELSEMWQKVEIYGGVENWTPTFYDPDSGGDPYYIHCECGIEFSIGYCDITEIVNAWNTRLKV